MEIYIYIHTPTSLVLLSALRAFLPPHFSYHGAPTGRMEEIRKGERVTGAVTVTTERCRRLLKEKIERVLRDNMQRVGGQVRTRGRLLWQGRS